MKKILLTVASLIYFTISVQAAACLHDWSEIFVGYATEHPTEEANFPCEDPQQCKLALRNKFSETSVMAPGPVATLLSWVFSGSLSRGAFHDNGIHSHTSFSPDIPGVSLFILHSVFRV